VGFDRLFEMLDNSIRPEWPPYDIERVDENAYRISMAVAGFSPEEIELMQQGSVLVVAGKKEAENASAEGHASPGARLPKLPAELQSRRSRQGEGREPRQRHAHRSTSCARFPRRSSRAALRSGRRARASLRGDPAARREGHAPKAA
jgi:hypothetical protein